MEYWRVVVENPTGNKATDEFAKIMDKIPKIVFSNTLKNVEWESAKLAHQTLEQEVLELKKSRNSGSKDILVGSRSLIVTLMNLNLIDEFQLCVHPIILRSGLTPLLKNINDSINLKLLKTKIFSCGAITLYYEPTKKMTKKV